MVKAKLSLGDRIAHLISEDNEDDFPDDNADHDTGAKVVEDFEDDQDEEKQNVKATRSVLRAKNVKLLAELDQRYAGTKTSRKKLGKDISEDIVNVLQDSEVDVSEDSNSEASENTSNDVLEESNELGSEDEDSEDLKVSDNEVSEDEVEISEDEAEISKDEAEISDQEAGNSKDDEEDEMQTIHGVDKLSEVEKAIATQNQLRIWDALLEVRIRMQRMLLESNKLPQTTVFKEVVTIPNDNFKLPSVLEKSRSIVQDFLENLIELQQSMTFGNPEIVKSQTRKRKPSNGFQEDEEILSDEIISSGDEEIKVAMIKDVEEKPQKHKLGAKKRKISDYETIINEKIEEFIPFRNDTIQKWNEKTQLSFGKYEKKSTFSHQVPTLKQIEHILSDKQKLIKKTQIKKTSYETIGQSKSQEEILSQPDEEIFDDDDFYHQLLRELIDRKTSNVSDPVQLSRHWLELQKLRTKLKRKVDTKASKGRKIRYDVHSKLVNFMAPHDNCAMSDNAVKELMSSLFGKLNNYM